jgi:hypothetical protein
MPPASSAAAGWRIGAELAWELRVGGGGNWIDSREVEVG